MTDADPFDLGRFVAAQDGIYATALAELRGGRKASHWMWFVFPQVAGLGSSAMTRRYAIRSLGEARAYLAHPLLGDRLRECIVAATAAPGTAIAVFGAVDALKLRSSLTLFAAAGGGAAFTALLDRWFDGPDPRTTALLAEKGLPLEQREQPETSILST